MRKKLLTILIALVLGAAFLLAGSALPDHAPDRPSLTFETSVISPSRGEAESEATAEKNRLARIVLALKVMGRSDAEIYEELLKLSKRLPKEDPNYFIPQKPRSRNEIHCFPFTYQGSDYLLEYHDQGGYLVLKESETRTAQFTQ